jgi:hypothetical protein
MFPSPFSFGGVQNNSEMECPVPHWFLIGVLVLGALYVFNAIFSARVRWFSERSAEFTALLPMLRSLSELTRDVEKGGDKIAFAEHFDFLAHIFFSSAYADPFARRLLEIRMRETLEGLRSAGIDTPLYASVRFERSRMFESTKPTYR